jgi:hypothetical protein
MPSLLGEMLMTDTFPSGFSNPAGGAHDAGEPTGDVTGTLAELERKLRELERELTSIGRRRVRPEGDVAETQTAASLPAGGQESLGSGSPGQASLPTGRLVDERMEPQPPAPAQPQTPQEYTPPPMPRGHIPQPTPREYAPPSMPREHTPAPMPRGQVPPLQPPFGASADEPPRPTEAQLASLAELRRFRERLERVAKDLVADYDAVLARAMSGVSLGARGESQAPPPPPPVSEEPLFEGRVELGVGPFYDIGSLGAFEQSVASVPNVTEVSVRRFEASHAVVDVRLAAPVALLSELRRVLATDFGVRHVASGRIALTFDET